MDGYVTIGTKLDTKDLESGIKKAEAELNRLDKEAKKLTEQKVTLEADNSELQQTIDKYDELVSQAESYKSKLKELEASGTIWLQGEAQLEQITNEINKQEKGMLKAGEQIDKNNAKLEAIDKQLKDNASSQDIVNAKVKEMNTELAQSQRVEGLKGAINGIQERMSGIVRNAVKWGVAIFGVRSAYSFLTSSLSTLSQYNQKMATDVEYIRWALAMTLKPVIEFIIKLAYQLLSILRSIILALFKYDIFAKAGADAFRKAKQSTGGIDNNLGKSVKKAKELNKQLASFDEMNILGDNTKVAGDTGTTGGGASGGNVPMPSYSLDDMIEPIDWGKIIDGVRNGLERVGNVIIEKWNAIKTSLANSDHPLAQPLLTFMEQTEANLGLLVEGFRNAFKGITQIIEGFVDDVNWDTIFEGVLQLGKGIGQMIIAGINQAFAVKDLIVNSMINLGKSFGKWILEGWKENGQKAIETIASWIASKLTGQKVTIKWGDLKSGLGDAIKKIKEKLNKLKEDIGKIFKKIGTAVGNAFKSAFKTIFNKLVSSIESRLNTPINAINSMIGVINKLLPKKKELKKLNRITLPRLAKGGIVNLPGSGVPVGTAVAGERGAEGVIPLTDSQQMALLGEAIGKYITINANITNNMNGRVISRELQKIQNDNNFAYNR